jgi:hypothetical protein
MINYKKLREIIDKHFWNQEDGYYECSDKFIKDLDALQAIDAQEKKE